MTRTSYRFLLGGSLLAAAAIALVIFSLGLDENAAKPDTSGVKPLIFFDNDSRVVAYQLQRLSNDQLVKVERHASDPKYRPAYEALLMRDGLATKYRREAIHALVDLNESDAVTEILAGIERRGEQSGALQRELSNMLLQQEPSELAGARGRLEQTAAGSEVSAVRTASYAALVMSAPADEVWRLASRGNRGEHDLLLAIPMAPGAKRRDAFYTKVEPLLHRNDAAELRRAAIEILPSFTGHDEESFETLAGFIRGGVERPAAIRSILRIGKEHWPDGEIAPLAEAIVAHVLEAPANERADAPFLEAVRLGNELASMLDAKVGGRIRGILDELGVTVILLRTLIDQTSYDKRRIVVETGKRVEIVLQNEDFMPHNLVITVPGAREEIGLAADRMPTPARPDSQGRYYVPASPKVLHATRLVQPGQASKLNFEAPAEPGDYPYLCTFNGHWRRMFGHLLVVKDLEEYLKNPPPLEDPDYTEWTLSDLADDVADLDTERSAAGQEVFNDATCAKCHRVAKLGKDFCPDLSDVFERYDDDSVRVLTEILVPSKTIEEEYMNYLFVLTNGEVATGIITAEDSNSLTVQSSGDDSLAVTVDKSDIIERDKRAVSIMPVGLLDTFRRDQIADLMAFLKYGAVSTARPASARARTGRIVASQSLPTE